MRAALTGDSREIDGRIARSDECSHMSLNELTRPLWKKTPALDWFSLTWRPGANDVSFLEPRSIRNARCGSWAGGRAVECSGLENRWTFTGPVGSNPTLPVATCHVASDATIDFPELEETQ